MKVGDKFKKAFPFFMVKNEFSHPFHGSVTEEYWVAGCVESTEDGCEIYDGGYESVVHYECDAEGFIEYEVLAIVDMPRKIKQRVIYTTRLTEPGGKVRKASAAKMVTITKFQKWADATHTSYPRFYTER